jgi:hypothetical protein
VSDEPKEIIDKVTACPHPNFSATVNVERRADLNWFRAEVRVRCVHCGAGFRFLGPPALPNENQDGLGTLDDGFRLLAPIAPRYGPMTGIAEATLAAMVAGGMIAGRVAEMTPSLRASLFKELLDIYCVICGHVEAECECVERSVDDLPGEGEDTPQP